MRKSRGLNDTYFKDPDSKPQTTLSAYQLTKFAWQVADGMCYLSSKKVGSSVFSLLYYWSESEHENEQPKRLKKNLKTLGLTGNRTPIFAMTGRNALLSTELIKLIELRRSMDLAVPGHRKGQGSTPGQALFLSTFQPLRLFILL